MLRTVGTNATEGRAVDDVVAAVGNARPHLVDAWEAIALLESLGYTDARVKRGFGFADTRAFGEFVFDRLSGRRIPPRGEDAASREPVQPFSECVAASWIYAVPWLAALILDRTVPDGLRLAGFPPFSLALMLSLIVTGGFVQAMTRRARFYFGIEQPGFAALVCGYIFRLGAIVAVAAAGTGLVIGWYLNRSMWPSLVFWADQFVILSALWLTCGVLTVRREHWRVLGAFAAGAIGFVLARAFGLDTLTAQLVALGAVLAAAAVQAPRVFAQAGDTDRPPSVPIPRLTILFYQGLPFFWYGTAYFCFLFGDRLVTSADNRLPMDLALISFLFAAAGIEYANVQFIHRLTQATHTPFASGLDACRHVIGRLHLQALITVGGGFVVTASIVGGLAKGLLSGAASHFWTMLAIGDVGYLLLALGVVNALVLFRLNRPWGAMKAVAAGLVLNLAIVWLSRAFNMHDATAGLLVGGALFFVQSTVVVRQTLRRADHAIATAS